VSENEIIGTRGRLSIPALNYFKIRSADPDLIGSEERLSRGGCGSRCVDELYTSCVAWSDGDCFQKTILSLETGLERDSVTISSILLTTVF